MCLEGYVDRRPRLGGLAAHVQDVSCCQAGRVPVRFTIGDVSASAGMRWLSRWSVHRQPGPLFSTQLTSRSTVARGTARRGTRSRATGSRAGETVASATSGATQSNSCASVAAGKNRKERPVFRERAVPRFAGGWPRVTDLPLRCQETVASVKMSRLFWTQFHDPRRAGLKSCPGGANAPLNG